MIRDVSEIAGFELGGELDDGLSGSLLELEEWRDLIAAELFETPERLDIRLLWSRDGSSFCRVNVWHTNGSAGAGRIYQSLFVALDDTPEGPRVRDLTRRRAA